MQDSEKAVICDQGSNKGDPEKDNVSKNDQLE